MRFWVETALVGPGAFVSKITVGDTELFFDPPIEASEKGLVNLPSWAVEKLEPLGPLDRLVVTVEGTQW